MELSNPSDLDNPPDGAATRTSTTVLVVELSRGMVDFHRLVSALHRKHVGFASLLFADRRVIIFLTPDKRSLEQLVSIVKRETVVINVETHRIEEAAATLVLDKLLSSEP